MTDTIVFCVISGFLAFIAVGTIVADIYYNKTINKLNKDFNDDLKNI